MGLPFKPGDWVSDDMDRLARVKRVYEGDGETLLDLVMFDRDGAHLGRVSPACGGPRTFEPCCSVGSWRRIKVPSFPVELKWVESSGKRVARYYAGIGLPPANWTPPKRRLRFSAIARPAHNASLRRALQKIADGHNDARQLAKDTLAST